MSSCFFSSALLRGDCMYSQPHNLGRAPWTMNMNLQSSTRKDEATIRQGLASVIWTLPSLRRKGCLSTITSYPNKHQQVCIFYLKNPVMLLTVQTPNLPGPCFESKTILSDLPSSCHSQTLLNRTFAVQILHLLPSCLTQVQSKTSLWIQPGPFFIRVWWRYDVKATTCFIYLETWKTSRDQLA